VVVHRVETRSRSEALLVKSIATCLAVLALAFSAVADPSPDAASSRKGAAIERIRERAEQSSTIPAFVSWLRRQANVSDVDYDRDLLLTTDPPHQSVTFSVDGRRHRFLLLRDGGGRVTLTADEQLK
jgi:hypothetical protein